MFALGAGFERYCLRRVHKFGHVPELLVTFGLSYLILEVVQLVWGRSTVPYGLPRATAGPAVHAVWHAVPQVALVRDAGGAVDAAVGVAAAHPTHRLVIQAALNASRDGGSPGPQRAARVHAGVLAAAAALAGLAGVIGGNTYVTEPAMAASVGSIIFVVVVVGGMGSLAGAFLASLLIGIVQTFAVALDYSLIHAFKMIGVAVTEQTLATPCSSSPSRRSRPSCRTCSWF